MRITKEDVIRVAHLARLDLESGAIDNYVEQIGEVLDYVNMLDQVDTDGVAPTCHVIALTNPFRDDDLVESLARRNALANAPEQENGDFLVPRIIKG